MIKRCILFPARWILVQFRLRFLNLSCLRIGLALLSLLVCAGASAHIKWFAPYDIIAEPKSIWLILSPSFTIIAVLSVAIIFVSAWIDKAAVSAGSKIDGYRLLVVNSLAPHYQFDILRYTLIIFFTAVWTLGDVVLTPELKHNSVWISSTHLLIIASLLFRRTAWLAGVCVFGLWIYSAVYYGFFHLTDYIIFLGIAAFIVISSLSLRSTVDSKRYAILYGAISFTLLWASIEKFVYPHWSYPIIDAYPHLAMGLSKESFMDLAGFGEFVLAFMLICMSGLSFTLATLFLAAIFIAAIYDFGKIDAVGHLAIIVSLGVMAIHGPSGINRWFSNLHRRPFVNAIFVTLIYCVSLVFFFIIYYLVRKAWLLTTMH